MDATATRRGERHYRYIDLVTAAYVTVLVLFRTSSGQPRSPEVDLPLYGTYVFRRWRNCSFRFPYVFGDILTEVYGYARARRVIWTGFAALGFASLMAAVRGGAATCILLEEPTGL